MSESIDTIRSQLWEKMRAGGKPYRDKFVAAHLSTNIAAQIQTLREVRGWSQKELADRAGMSPARISVMEDPSYEGLTLSTLKRIASAFDVALITRFGPFSDLVRWVSELSPQRLQAPSFDEDQIINVVNTRPPSMLGGTSQSVEPLPRELAAEQDARSVWQPRAISQTIPVVQTNQGFGHLLGAMSQ